MSSPTPAQIKSSPGNALQLISQKYMQFGIDLRNGPSGERGNAKTPSKFSSPYQNLTSCQQDHSESSKLFASNSARAYVIKPGGSVNFN